jgi:hypothetical protein
MVGAFWQRWEGHYACRISKDVNGKPSENGIAARYPETRPPFPESRPADRSQQLALKVSDGQCQIFLCSTPR